MNDVQTDYITGELLTVLAEHRGGAIVLRANGTVALQNVLGTLYSLERVSAMSEHFFWGGLWRA